MKLYLARFKCNEGGESYVLVFPTARERAQYVQREEDLGNEYEVEKHTCEFPATKEGIVAFFNRHAWHYQ
tara:strand:+ start:532 stop:741 length:210 start_codon:yes stop_codon:yes gene_type:complete